MIGKQVIGEKPVTVREVRELLEKRKEKGELNYEQKISLEYAQEFGKAKQKKVQEVIDKLVKEGIDAKTAVKLVDLEPTTKEELKLIFEKVRFRLTEDSIKKVLDIVSELD
jgi:DNA-directed RNA polymerase subunit F